MKLILASTSVYRKQMLERLKVPFDCVDPQFDEGPLQEKIKDPLELTKELAAQKAHAAARSIKGEALIIGGDQVSLFNDEILGKPITKEAAASQLKKLQNQTHQLHTSVCLVHLKESGDTQEIHLHDVTTLKMHALSDEQIERYIQKDDPLHCAGSYKIESLGISLFEQVQTNDFSAIVGLPLMTLSQKLRSFGFELP